MFSFSGYPRLWSCPCFRSAARIRDRHEDSQRAAGEQQTPVAVDDRPLPSDPLDHSLDNLVRFLNLTSDPVPANAGGPRASSPPGNFSPMVRQVKAPPIGIGGTPRAFKAPPPGFPREARVRASAKESLKRARSTSGGRSSLPDGRANQRLARPVPKIKTRHPYTRAPSPLSLLRRNAPGSSTDVAKTGNNWGPEWVEGKNGWWDRVVTGVRVNHWVEQENGWWEYVPVPDRNKSSYGATSDSSNEWVQYANWNESSNDTMSDWRNQKSSYWSGWDWTQEWEWVWSDSDRWSSSESVESPRNSPQNTWNWRTDSQSASAPANPKGSQPWSSQSAGDWGKEWTSNWNSNWSASSAADDNDSNEWSSQTQQANRAFWAVVKQTTKDRKSARAPSFGPAVDGALRESRDNQSAAARRLNDAVQALNRAQGEQQVAEATQEIARARDNADRAAAYANRLAREARRK